MTNDEVKWLLETSPQPWKDIWYAFLVTGLRMGELVNMTFDDVDWEAKEIVVRGSVAKNHKPRRIPIDKGLWTILVKQRDSREMRQPGKGKTPKITALVQARLSKNHVFVSTQNTPLTNRSTLYHVFIGYCKRAGIETRTFDTEGREVEHVDVHSLRRTFATNLIVGGADPKTVQELLGHKTLEMTMKIYTKIRSGTKRQALARLSYGQGSVVPDGVLEYTKEVNSVQNGHKLATSKGTGTDG